MSAFKTLPQNELGRDFVVGDIHGCYDELSAMLLRIEFNSDADRLISVGDLVDRGAKSEDCLDWLVKPWFHAVRGNHEEMCIESVKYGHAENIMRSNGGAWFLELHKTVRQVYADAFEDLPIAMEVMTPGGLVGIVHAECPLDDWDVFKAKLETDSHLRDMTMWSRVRSKGRTTTPIKGVDLVISGHTPMKEPLVAGNSVFIDTGRCFKDGHFTVMDITNDRLYTDA